MWANMSRPVARSHVAIAITIDTCRIRFAPVAGWPVTSRFLHAFSR
jgi:hypothetical protein